MWTTSNGNCRKRPCKNTIKFWMQFEANKWAKYKASTCNLKLNMRHTACRTSTTRRRTFCWKYTWRSGADRESGAIALDPWLHSYIHTRLDRYRNTAVSFWWQGNASFLIIKCSNLKSIAIASLPEVKIRVSHASPISTLTYKLLIITSYTWKISINPSINPLHMSQYSVYYIYVVEIWAFRCIHGANGDWFMFETVFKMFDLYCNKMDYDSHILLLVMKWTQITSTEFIHFQ